MSLVTDLYCNATHGYSSTTISFSYVERSVQISIFISIHFFCAFLSYIIKHLIFIASFFHLQNIPLLQVENIFLHTAHSPAYELEYQVHWMQRRCPWIHHLALYAGLCDRASNLCRFFSWIQLRVQA